MGWFGTFIQMEGKRYFAAHTEIELASRIQQQLVPPINKTIGKVEIYGISIPSGTVGGDLLDLIEADGITCVYVADLAGHGSGCGCNDEHGQNSRPNAFHGEAADGKSAS